MNHSLTCSRRRLGALASMVTLFCGGLAAGSAVAADAPTHFILDGEVVARELDPHTLVARFQDGLDPGEFQEIAAAATGVPVIATESLGRHSPFVRIRFESATTGPRDAYDRIEALIRAPEIGFASPVFLDPAGIVVPTDEIVLRVKMELSGGDAEALARSLASGLQITDVGFAGASDVFVLQSPSSNGFDVLARANEMALDDGAHFAEPNCLATGRVDMIPTDDLFEELWGLENTGQEEGMPYLDMMLDEAWDITTGSSEIEVLILDTGVQLNHPDLNVAGGRDFRDPGGANEPNDGNPENGNEIHGTAVAGCVSALMNGVGAVGVAPGCPILSGRFAENTTCSNFSFYYSDLAAAISWGRQQGARVSVSSFSIPHSGTVDDAYELSRKNGMIHFAAAGNDGIDLLDYPARSNHVNAVGAINRFGERASFSNYGNATDELQFTGPGEDIWTTDRTGNDGYCPNDYCFGSCTSSAGVENDYVLHSGTSFSAPYVAGVAALVLSMDPSLNSDQVQHVLRCTARDMGEIGHDDEFGWGLPVAYAALTFPVRRINVRSDLTQTTDFDSDRPAISGNGRFVAFHSRSNDLDHPNGNGGLDDVFVHDRATGLTSAVSWRPFGTIGASSDPDISWSGRYVAFATTSYDTNGYSDIYVMDRDLDENGIMDQYGQCGGTWCGWRLYQISENSLGNDANGGSYEPSISADARYVAFASDATDLVTSDTNGATDVFVRDLETDTTVRLSVTSAGGQSNERSQAPAISADGRYVAYESWATNLAGSDTNGFLDVYVRDRDVSGNGTFDEPGDVATFRASFTQSGGEPNWDSGVPSIAVSSENGHLLISYATGAWNMGSNDGNFEFDIYLYDVDAGTTSLMSETAAGQAGNGGCFESQLSDDGLFLTFESFSSDLVVGDGNGVMDVFLRRLSIGNITLVSVDEAGAQGDGVSVQPAISRDGEFVAYASRATNLVPDDTNGLQDIFVLECAPIEAPRIVTQPSHVQVEIGETAVLMVEAEGTPPPSYQWRFDGVDIPGAIYSAYIIDEVTEADYGDYDVVVSNPGGTVVSEVARVDGGTPAVGDHAGEPGALSLPRLVSHPNPLRATAAIQFTVPRTGHVELHVLDVSGRRVRSLVQEHLSAGDHRAEWDGRLENGAEVASGMYYYVLSTNGATHVQRVTVLR